MNLRVLSHWYCQPLPFLTFAISKRRELHQSGSNECSFKVHGEVYRSDFHQGHENISGNASDSFESLVEYVCFGGEGLMSCHRSGLYVTKGASLVGLSNWLCFSLLFHPSPFFLVPSVFPLPSFFPLHRSLSGTFSFIHILFLDICFLVSFPSISRSLLQCSFLVLSYL